MTREEAISFALARGLLQLDIFMIDAERNIIGRFEKIEQVPYDRIGNGVAFKITGYKLDGELVETIVTIASTGNRSLANAIRE